MKTDFLERPELIGELSRVELGVLLGAVLAKLLTSDASIPALPASAPSTPAAEPVMLTRRQVALRLAVSVATLDRMVDRGAFPKPKMVGAHSPRWSEAVVTAWERKA